MSRDAMYRFLQACLTGLNGYATEDGVTCYRHDRHDEPHTALVLDALIDRYLMTTDRSTRVAVRELAVTIGVRPEEVVRAITALSNITLVSNHIEERLIRIDRVDIDDRGLLSVVIGFNGWLAYHLLAVCEAPRQQSSNGEPEAELIS